MPFLGFVNHQLSDENNIYYPFPQKMQVRHEQAIVVENDELCASIDYPCPKFNEKE